MIERLAQYVAVRSVSGEEAALADLIAGQLAEAGLEVHRQGNNLWAEIGDAPRPRLLLNSHLDTVPPGEGWTGDPWTPRREADRLVGLGTNDAKGCVTALDRGCSCRASAHEAGRKARRHDRPGVTARGGDHQRGPCRNPRSPPAARCRHRGRTDGLDAHDRAARFADPARDGPGAARPSRQHAPAALPRMPWSSPPRTCCACRNSTGAPVIRSLAGHTAT